MQRGVPPNMNILAQQIAKQIEATGPISVSEYMRISNEAYYASGDPFGVDGDFITAPEVSQIFGELVGLWFADIWLRHNTPQKVHYVELGPGRGTLAKDALRAMARFELKPDVHFFENSKALRTQQQEAVPTAAFYDDLDDLPEDGPLFIVANEFFDALPVRQYVATASGWRERVVARDRAVGFSAIPGSRPADSFVPRDLSSAPPGSIYEVSGAMSDVMYALTNRLAQQGGVILVIDYGYTQMGLGSTLQAVKDHKFVSPFSDPGEVDLTAHVNFLELANFAHMRNLRNFGPVEQGAWLTSLGINARAQMLANENPDQADDITAARNRLASPEEMGSLFKVLALTTLDWPEPEGFAKQIS